MTEIISHERFASVVNVHDEEDRLQQQHPTGFDVFGNPTTIALITLATSSSTFGIQNTSTKAIVDLISDYNLRDVSLSSSILSDELLKALSVASSSVNLKTLRIEAHPENKPTAAKVSTDAWSNFIRHHPHMNLVVSSYMTKEDDFEGIIESYIPVTHLYLGESTPSSVVKKIAAKCPRLIELVIGAYPSDTLDQILESIAGGCPELSALALGECEITCTSFVKFVELCCKRLQVLYVWETSLLEDSNYDLTQVISKVSSLLGRSWQPEYIPCW